MVPRDNTQYIYIYFCDKIKIPNPSHFPTKYTQHDLKQTNNVKWVYIDFKLPFIKIETN